MLLLAIYSGSENIIFLQGNMLFINIYSRSEKGFFCLNNMLLLAIYSHSENTFFCGPNSFFKLFILASKILSFFAWNICGFWLFIPALKILLYYCENNMLFLALYFRSEMFSFVGNNIIFCLFISAPKI